MNSIMELGGGKKKTLWFEEYLLKYIKINGIYALHHYQSLMPNIYQYHLPHFSFGSQPLF